MFSPCPFTISHFSFDLQDGDDASVMEVAKEFDLVGVRIVQRTRTERFTEGAQYIATMYKFALSHVFEEDPLAQVALFLSSFESISAHSLFCFLYQHAIVIEDDMIFSKDFLWYFAQMAPLMDIPRVSTGGGDIPKDSNLRGSSPPLPEHRH